jgi:thiamine biosynthesis lipoprotein
MLESTRISTVKFVAMDTCVSVQVLSAEPEYLLQNRFDRIQEWFFHVEQICSRFDTDSEVCYLAEHPGKPVRVSPLLFHLLQVTQKIAHLSHGVFDPTMGYQLVQAGFDQHYLTGQRSQSFPRARKRPDYREIVLDRQQQTVMLRCPLLLDLGGVAKGLALDLAAQELARFSHYTMDAGGDLYVRGENERQRPWRIGIRHPRQTQDCLALLEGPWKDGAAICTSGDYERAGVGVHTRHHILDPRTGHSAQGVASVTVIAPHALLADALSTAAFVLGPAKGLKLLRKAGLPGLIISSSLEWFMTPEMGVYIS